jgi:hypothetical protein
VSSIHLVPALQTAIGPMILVSGVGLVLLTMTNRLGRIVDRARALAAERRAAAEVERPRLEAQLAVLERRARLVRGAIALATLSVLAAALLVIVLFLAAVLGIDGSWPVAALFVAAMAALAVSLVLFLQDVDVSLVALGHEIAAPPTERD